MSNLDFLEILHRARTGPSQQKQRWDFDVILSTTRSLVEKYHLTWDKTELIPHDPSIADRVFQAALELMTASGVFSISTGRTILFTEEEILDGLQNAPKQVTMGFGKDACVMSPRRITDTTPPRIWGGNPGSPTPHEMFLPMVKSWMQEPLVDVATCGSMTQFKEMEVITGEATEVLVTREELRLLRQALQEMGRPDMGLLAGQSSSSDLGDLAISHPDYLRPWDAHLIPLFNELIIDSHNLTRVANSLDYGMINASLATVMVGGLAGDAPGAAIVQAASFMAANLVCQAHLHLLHPIHIRHVATTTRSVLWVQSVVSQAFARNAPCIIIADIYPKSGAMTQEIFYEVAANAIAAALSGAHLEGVGSADGALPHCSGLEVRFMAEVAQAVTRQQVDIPEANHLVLDLLQRYEHVFQNPNGNPGLPFDQIYNLETLKPIPAWERMYEQAKKDLRAIGLQGMNEVL